MKLLSVDVGIKNLAICILETTSDVTLYKILFWEVIDLCKEQNRMCDYIIKNKQKTTHPTKCTKSATLEKNGCFYCKSHATKTEYKLPASDLNKHKRFKLDKLIELTVDYDISYSKPPSKINLINGIETFIENYVFNNVNTTKCNNFSLIDIGILIKEKLDKLILPYFLDIDLILIENQIGPIANRMTAIQGMITQYFIMKNMKNISYVSAANKLKLFITNKKTTYNQRKKLSIDITKNLLNMNNNDSNSWMEYICKHKKADDLADSFLQGIWYLISEKLLEINMPNII